tara:strand:+ start:32859 stop:33002 length:144 start_codon:yes stop_codon:yes gene_type:complete
MAHQLSRKCAGCLALLLARQIPAALAKNATELTAIRQGSDGLWIHRK